MGVIQNLPGSGTDFTGQLTMMVSLWLMLTFVVAIILTAFLP